MTQQVAHDMKVGARKEADLIMGRAELEAERLLDQAHERLTNLLTDISNLKRQRSQLESELNLCGPVRIISKLFGSKKFD